MMLLAIIASGLLVRLIPVLPVPLAQVAVGAALSSIAGFKVDLDPAVFFLLFIPPLLFLDGRRIPKGAFFRDLAPILTLAVGLVFFIVVGLGILIHWGIPGMGLPVAFALAAMLSPTDPVAVSAIAARAPIPSRLMNILEGEALLNDASGLVSFQFAVAAVMTGSFSLARATLSFLVLAAVGVIIGIAVSWIVGFINHLIVKRTHEDPGSQVLVSVLVPFAAYLIAEHLHGSGILAAASAGITMHYVDLKSRRSVATRLQRNAFWDILQLILNGAMFVLLGEQLPSICARLFEGATGNRFAFLGRAVGYVLAITAALTVLRFIWVWASLRLTLFRSNRKNGQPATGQRSMTRVLWVTSFAGVRGAITLAGILTLPLLLPTGILFPSRDLMIFLAMGVILSSLTIGSFALPWLTRGMTFVPSDSPAEMLADARASAAQAAVKRLEEIQATAEANSAAAGHPEIATRLLDWYRSRLHNAAPDIRNVQDVIETAEAARSLRVEALRAERDDLYRLRRAHKIDDIVHRQLVREIDLMEAALSPQNSE